MKKTITIVTSNKGKIHSLTHALEGLDFEVESLNLNLLEPQYDTIEEVAKYKAAEAFRLLKKPLIVHDGGLVVPALKGFPGVYTKYVSSTLTPQDFVNLMKDKQDKTCYLTQSMIYVDEKGELHQFQDKLMGKIADKVSTVDNDKGWGMLWQVFVPKGADKPLAEIPEDVFYNQIRPLAKTNSVWEDLKSFLIKAYNIPTPEVKKTVEVALKKVEKPIVPVTKEADDSLKKKEVPTNKGQGLDVKPVETLETKEKSSQTNENRVQSSENVVQTSENNTFEKWFDNLGELMEKGYFTQIKKTLSHVFYENEQFVFDNENEKFYFSKADINKQNKFGHTLAMFFAQYVSSDSASIIKRDRSSLSLGLNVDLLRDVDWQKKDKQGRTVLHYYCQNGEVEYRVLENMANKRFDFYERDAYGISPLLCLFSRNTLEKLEYISWMFGESEFLQNNFSKALDQEGNNFLITLLEKNNWKPHKKAQSKEDDDEDDDYEYDEGENDDEYEMEQIRDLTEGIVYYIRDLSGVKSKDGLSLLQYIKKHNLKEFCEYLAENARDEKMAKQAKVLFLNSKKEKTTAKKNVKPAVAQKEASKKETEKTSQKEAEKSTDKKTSAKKVTSKATVNMPSAPKKIATQAPKKRVSGKGRSNGE